MLFVLADLLSGRFQGPGVAAKLAPCSVFSVGYGVMSRCRAGRLIALVTAAYLALHRQPHDRERRVMAVGTATAPPEFTL